MIIRKYADRLDEERMIYPDNNRMNELVRSCEILDMVEDILGSLEQGGALGRSQKRERMRFVMGNPTVSTTIPGMRRLRHVKANTARGHAGPRPAQLQ